MACKKSGQADWNVDFSYDSFRSDSSSIDCAAGDCACKPQTLKGDDGEKRSIRSGRSTSTSSSSFSQLKKCQPCDSQTVCEKDRKIPDTCYEMSIAKSILQQYSTLSGTNLYDHLTDIIKRVLDERPPNVVDFFEEFSRNVREQKFHCPERFPPAAIFELTRMYKVAKKQLKSMRLPYDLQELQEYPQQEDVVKSEQSDLNLELAQPHAFFNVFSERIQQLQFYWNQCGFSISTDDIFLLAASMDRLQTHPSIRGCRFWGVINGLKASYYIVEAALTKEHLRKRLQQMKSELREKFQSQLHRECVTPELPAHIGPELTPGFYGWENFPEEQLEQMTPKAAPIPLPRPEEIYDIPPEMIGSGLNRFSYFVVNSLTDDWLELPIVTPKQIVIARQIKKFFTGDMEAEIMSYPCFPGKEKHYLRAMIARITCGTTIAPKYYYRKMTKSERRIYEGDDDDVDSDGEDDYELMDDDDYGEDGYGKIDNDILPLRNENYKIVPLENLDHPCNWVHVRPYLLKQGRVVWFDQERARKEREKELARLCKLDLVEESAEDDELDDETSEDTDLEDEDIGDGQGLKDRREIGPNIFTACNCDCSDEFTVPWISRLTSHFTNKCERVLVMRSNVWTGSYTFTFGNVCETVYMGWGQKSVSRNMPFYHLPPIVKEYPHRRSDFIETTDPSVAEEEAYIAWLKHKNEEKRSKGYYGDEYDGEGVSEDYE